MTVEEVDVLLLVEDAGLGVLPGESAITGAVYTMRIGSVRFLSTNSPSIKSGQADLLHSSYHVCSFST